MGHNEKEVENEKLKDVIGAKYLKFEKSVCFLESSVYVVEVLVREHGKAEVIEDKEKGIENLKTYETFEDVDDEGQETIGSRWIVTEKEKHDGQKQNYKARLVKGVPKKCNNRFCAKMGLPIKNFHKTDPPKPYI